ncbi:hypothetical protein LguiA_011879 [Lonicera macranthoides]
MASSLVKSQKNMRRTESKKSHSWWWDSHVSPKNSKWLAENLEDMDQSVKRMLKLIEGDGDSFAKKVDLYYQKRPELISHVEEFYRMYRSLAERYDHVTGELRKSIPSDLQSQGSGMSDLGSELASVVSPPGQDSKVSRRKMRPRAAGFEFFLGNGGSSSDLCNKEGDETSTLDSYSESDDDDSSINNYSTVTSNGDDVGMRRKIIELEVELRDVKEKLQMQHQEENSYDSPRGNKYENSENLFARIAGYEEELKVARENIRLSEEEIAQLRLELNKHKSMEPRNDFESPVDESQKYVNILDAEPKINEGIDGLAVEISDPELKINNLEKELKITKSKLHDSDKEVTNLKSELERNGSTIRNLQEQLGSARKESSGWKSKLDKEKKEVTKMQDRIARYKANLSDRDQEIRGLRETVSNANKSLSEENSNLQAEVTRLLKERAYLEDNLKELDLRCQSFEEEVRRANAGKAEMESLLGAEIEQLKKRLDELKLKYETIMGERDELNVKVAKLNSEMSSKDNQIERLSKHLDELHVQHVELIGGINRSRKVIEGLRSRVEELEIEIERKEVVILEGAEGKREAIRQLCFSIEHYRDEYRQLRQAFVGHRRLAVISS